MEAEEVDKIFRAQLDSLEQVPGLTWEGDKLWPKVKAGIMGGLSPWWVGSLSIFVALIVTIGYLYHAQGKKGVQPVQVKEAQRPYVEPKHYTLSAKGEHQIPKSQAIQKLTSNAKKEVKKPDTVSLRAPERRMPLLRPLTLQHPSIRALKYSTKPIGAFRQDFKFKMPHYPMLTLKVNNSLNIDNLEQMIEVMKMHGQNYSYRYQYNPDPYAGTFLPFRKVSQGYLIIEDYHK
ncbi:MAG TPA: hypothetical protein VL947_12560 [Cytophagales bacterium]|nr:hypothetical protein [Cytophagales bacterium]